MVSPEHPFPVVGIGASAGGLEALQHFLRLLPADPGLAFIIVTHRARGHEDALAEILQRSTALPVGNVSHGIEVEINNIYVCPADTILTVDGRRLHMQPRGSDVQRKPIDVFLGSLADQFGEASVGILLSGAGSDGALGIKAIKERGGFTLAQTSNGSGPKQSGMPDSAIAAGVVDLAIPVEQMSARLVEYAKNYAHIEALAREAAGADGQNRMYREIYRILLNQIGHDFSGYKEKTFSRRVLRRMQVCQIGELDAYVGLLRSNPDEVTALFRDLLIGVTNFFRDPDAFLALEQQVMPQLFRDKHAHDTIRIWVPGCATGEEVYSLAILAKERLADLQNQPKVQIFATDIDEPALAIARAGRYPAALLDGVSPERIRRFFDADDVSFAIKKEVREICIFSPHSILRDPPFSRMDLVSCRNLLIYLGTKFQAHVIPVFHFALRPKGFLFLGTSENISQHAELFSPLDKKNRIFQRRDQAVTTLHNALFTPGSRLSSGLREGRRGTGGTLADLRRSAEARIAEQFSPAHVVVNAEGDILHYSPRTGKYLEAPVGQPSRQLLAMARRGLRLDLRSALKEAAETRRRVSRDNLVVELEEPGQTVNVTVEPFGDPDSDPLFLVIFEDAAEPAAGAAPQPPDQAAAATLVDRLEQDLRDTKERLQSIIEEYETAVEELKSSNEELQSVNEELQSTNEELETSKEELQSVNEELNTVNSELNAKVDEVDRAHSDLRNIFDSTQIATVFLDRNLIIRSFTPAVTAIFNLIASDQGRPLTDIVSRLKDSNLRHEIHSVLESGNAVERNVSSSDDRAHYLMRILPYRERNNVMEGVVVTFVDVTSLIGAQAHQKTLLEELNHRVRNMLTIVNALASQTMKQSSSMAQFADSFGGRIQAMARSYGLVAGRNWGAVDLRDIVAGQLLGVDATLSARIMIEGPPIWFKPTPALALGMVFHELATNALKFGALSNETGIVRVTWDVSRKPDGLTLTWKESGGPTVKKPDRKGFGSQLVERELEHTLSAKAQFGYHEKGFEATIHVPGEAKLYMLEPDHAA